ncbi:MAG TPA: hypothetical protein DCF68_18675 [Cyanothece sp. UBA12306]|nr:hypothetical protein [Cyanothece sp. UBA12306]
MSSKDNLINFLQSYKVNFSSKSVKVAGAFLKLFFNNLSALQYLSTLKKDKELLKARNLIGDLSLYWLHDEKWANITAISFFKKNIKWKDDNPDEIDLEIYMYQTIYPLIDKISEEVNKLKITDKQREVFAILLQTLLPFYFVKAANITEIVSYLTEKLSNFVCVGYPPKDYPQMETPRELANSWEYSACRGFKASYDQRTDIHFLLLTFNPQDDSITQKMNNKVEDAENEFIKRLAKLQEEEKDQSQQQSFSPTPSTVFPNYQLGLNYALSNEPILLNGMKVIFDQSAAVYPVSLQSKTISNQSEKFHFGFGKKKSGKPAPKAATTQDIGGATLSWTPKTEVELMRFATKEEVDQLKNNNNQYGFVVKHKDSTRNAVWFVDIDDFNTKSYTVDFANDRPYILTTKLKVTDKDFINFENVDPKSPTKFEGEAKHPDQVIVKSNEKGAYGIGRNLIDKNEINVQHNPNAKKQTQRRK